MVLQQKNGCESMGKTSRNGREIVTQCSVETFGCAHCFWYCSRYKHSPIHCHVSLRTFSRTAPSTLSPTASHTSFPTLSPRTPSRTHSPLYSLLQFLPPPPSPPPQPLIHPLLLHLIVSFPLICTLLSSTTIRGYGYGCCSS